MATTSGGSRRAGRSGTARIATPSAASGAAIPGRSPSSRDVYGHTGRGTYGSVNFVTCHDGFTLTDLVSYEHRHNEANEEDNADGPPENFSRNWGVEGPSDSLRLERLRDRMKRNFLA